MHKKRKKKVAPCTNIFYSVRVSKISANELREWMDRCGHNQESVASMLGTTAGTISRWLNEKVEVPLPMRKLLAYLIRGELPFPIQSVDEGWHLDFSKDEFLIIQYLSRRDGYSSPEEWIADKIRTYIAMTQTTIEKTVAAEDGAEYKIK